MTATCAVCLMPIVTRQDVRVHGAEIMHTRCARLGRETVGARLARETARLQADLVQAQEAILRLTAEHGGALGRALATRDAAIRQEGERHRERDQAVLERHQAIKDLEQAVRERDVARREIEALRSRTQAEPPGVAAETASADRQPDDSSARFALLEFD